MRFLIDRCAGRRLAEWLRLENHDVVESRALGPDPGDEMLLQWAAAEARILVTMDKDFRAFVFLEDAPHCGIVRLPDVPADVRIESMAKVLKDHSTDLANKAIITVRGGRIRVSYVS